MVTMFYEVVVSLSDGDHGICYRDEPGGRWWVHHARP
jgi:hypothetical protein